MHRLAYALGGFALGVGVGIAAMVPRTTPGADMVLRCRETVGIVEAMPEYNKAEFIRQMEAIPELKARYEVVKAIAAVEIP